MSFNVKCPSCGASVSYEPGTAHLSCQYCHHSIDIDSAGATEHAHNELDLDEYFINYENKASKVEITLLACTSCGANTELEPNQQSSFCPFCDTPLVMEQAKTTSLIKPAGILPFSISKDLASKNFKKWVNELWFAPNELKKKKANPDKFKGIYLPFWTYDCATSSRYTGQKGIHYYVTESYTGSDGKTKTRRKRRTRWHSVSGAVSQYFDDVLVPASDSVSQPKLNALEPWGLKDLVDYKDEYISGYLCESYNIDLKEGYHKAKIIIDNRIRNSIRQDIGGDEQRISSVNTNYYDKTFKHILLPTWVSAYRFKDKAYQILINARTGEVQGERPWSWIKISAAVISIVSLIGAAIYYFQNIN